MIVSVWLVDCSKCEEPLVSRAADRGVGSFYDSKDQARLAAIAQGWKVRRIGTMLNATCPDCQARGAT